MPLNGERNVILLMIAAQLQDVSFRNFCIIICHSVQLQDEINEESLASLSGYVGSFRSLASNFNGKDTFYQ